MAHELEKAQYAQDEKWMKHPETAWEYWEDGWKPLHCEPVWPGNYRRRPDAPTKCCRLCKHVTTPNNCNRHDEQRPVGYWIDTNDYPSWCPLDAEEWKEEHEDEIDRIRKKMENGMKHDNDEITEKPKRIKHTPQECDRGQKCAFVNGGECPDNCPLDAEAKQDDQKIIDSSGCKGCEFAGVKDGRICCNDPEEFVDSDTGDLCCRKCNRAEPVKADKCSTCRHEYEPKPVEKLAAMLDTGIAGFQVSIGDDGVWLRFEEDGQHASMNLNVYTEQTKGTIISQSILKWCVATKERCETEPKPRTIRLAAELPEPKEVEFELWSGGVRFAVVTETKADAEAWLAWWKEQVAK